MERVLGGPNVEWERSLDGKLYEVRQDVATTEKLAEAAREIRRTRLHVWANWQKRLLLVAAIATALAPYLVPLLYR